MESKEPPLLRYVSSFIVLYCFVLTDSKAFTKSIQRHYMVIRNVQVHHYLCDFLSWCITFTYHNYFVQTFCRRILCAETMLRLDGVCVYTVLLWIDVQLLIQLSLIPTTEDGLIYLDNLTTEQKEMTRMSIINHWRLKDEIVMPIFKISGSTSNPINVEIVV